MILHNGKQYARVSEILRPFNNFGHIDQEVLENKARIGVSAHEAICHDISEEFPCPSKPALGYFNSYLEWKKHLNPIFLKSEERFFDDEMMISGQIDALIKFSPKDTVPTLVDFKTSVQESKIVWPMQAHLYAYLLHKNNIPIQPRFLFVKLNKYGDLAEGFSYLFDPNIHARCMNAIEDFWENITK